MPHNQTTTIDTDTLMSFVFRAVDEVGAALNCALVVMGDRLGYYKALADGGPMTPATLAATTASAAALSSGRRPPMKALASR